MNKETVPPSEASLVKYGYSKFKYVGEGGIYFLIAFTVVRLLAGIRGK